MIKSISRNLKLSKSPRHNEQILALAMRQIEKMLQEMQNEGKDLSGLKLKKFQRRIISTADAACAQKPKKRTIPANGDCLKMDSRFTSKAVELPENSSSV